MKILVAICLMFLGLNSFSQEDSTQISNEDNKALGEQFLKENKLDSVILVTKSGLQYQIIKSGEKGAEKPGKFSLVKVNYHGTKINGDVFDSSIDRGKPHNFYVHEVIQGWQEALTQMKVGDKWKLFIPQDLAYGKRDLPHLKIAPYDVLIFEIEVLDVLEK